MSLNDDAWSLVERLAAGDADYEALSSLARELLERRERTDALVERRADEEIT
jgi:hypothetical protein